VQPAAVAPVAVAVLAAVLAAWASLRMLAARSAGVEAVEGGQTPLVTTHHLASIRHDRALRWFTASTTSG
jgi:hypothetical protein